MKICSTQLPLFDLSLERQTSSREESSEVGVWGCP
jgi:hypothetical protein